MFYTFIGPSFLVAPLAAPVESIRHSVWSFWYRFETVLLSFSTLA